jgi:hypothetical protein
LELWDRIVESHHELRGTNPENTWRERIVFDIQPHSGNTHAGYPIVLPNGNYKIMIYFQKNLTTKQYDRLHERTRNRVHI